MRLYLRKEKKFNTFVDRSINKIKHKITVYKTNVFHIHVKFQEHSLLAWSDNIFCHRNRKQFAIQKIIKQLLYNILKNYKNRVLQENALKLSVRS